MKVLRGAALLSSLLAAGLLASCGVFDQGDDNAQAGSNADQLEYAEVMGDIEAYSESVSSDVLLTKATPTLGRGECKAADLPNDDFSGIPLPRQNYTAPEGKCTTLDEPQPGVTAFSLLIKKHMECLIPGETVRPCNADYGAAKSAHKFGLGWDLKLGGSDEQAKAKARPLLTWLLKTDRRGNAHANALAWGVAMIIFDGHIWLAGSNTTACNPAWSESDDLKDWKKSWDSCTSECKWCQKAAKDKPASKVSAMHEDHIHFAFNDLGGSLRTAAYIKRDLAPDDAQQTLIAAATDTPASSKAPTVASTNDIVDDEVAGDVGGADTGEQNSAQAGDTSRLAAADPGQVAATPGGEESDSSADSPTEVKVSSTQVAAAGVACQQAAPVWVAGTGGAQLCTWTGCGSEMQMYCNPATAYSGTNAYGSSPYAYNAFAAAAAANATAATDAVTESQRVAAAASVTSSAETCNGKDDDGDGQIDEDNPGGGQTCTAAGIGQCRVGQLVCSGGMLRCQPGSPRVETCDGLDNDCDGQVDEGVAGCNAATVAAACTPSAEVCNGEDDNCDGVPDEGNPGGGGSCTIATTNGANGVGVIACVNGRLQCAPVLTANGSVATTSASADAPNFIAGANQSDAQLGCSVTAGDGAGPVGLWSLLLAMAIVARRRRRRYAAADLAAVNLAAVDPATGLAAGYPVRHQAR